MNHIAFCNSDITHQENGAMNSLNFKRIPPSNFKINGSFMWHVLCVLFFVSFFPLDESNAKSGKGMKEEEQPSECMQCVSVEICGRR